MTIDPMDIPPIDYGSDRYDYVEISGPGEPSGEWFEKLIAEPCGDCRANVFLKRVHFSIWSYPDTLDPSNRKAWDVKIAHDIGCPTLKKKEADGRSGNGEDNSPT